MIFYGRCSETVPHWFIELEHITKQLVLCYKGVMFFVYSFLLNMKSTFDSLATRLAQLYGMRVNKILFRAVIGRGVINCNHFGIIYIVYTTKSYFTLLCNLIKNMMKTQVIYLQQCKLVWSKLQPHPKISVFVIARQTLPLIGGSIQWHHSLQLAMPVSKT